jgi:hypothetical protein
MIARAGIACAAHQLTLCAVGAATTTAPAAARAAAGTLAVAAERRAVGAQGDGHPVGVLGDLAGWRTSGLITARFRTRLTAMLRRCRSDVGDAGGLTTRFVTTWLVAARLVAPSLAVAMAFTALAIRALATAIARGACAAFTALASFAAA